MSALAVHAPVPFSRLSRVELRKQLDTRSGRWFVIVIAAITALVMIPVAWFSEPADLTFMGFFGAAVLPQMFLLPVIGIMAATSEWSQRTAMVTFAHEPRRLRVAVAKLVSAVGLGLVVVVATAVIAAVANLVATLVRDTDMVWSLDGQMIGSIVLMQVILIAQGVGFGMLLQNTPVALVAYYVLPTAWTIVTNLIAAMREPAEWLDLGVATLPLVESGAITGGEWARLAVATTLWVLLPLAAGMWRMARREVK